MVLQEVAMKRGSSLPTYTQISHTQGVENRFIIGVKWQSYDARGVGSSKMEAKHNAAKEMLALLVASSAISQNQVSMISCHAAATTTIRPTNSVTSTKTMFTSVLDSCKSSNNSSISLPCSPVLAPSLENAFVNYVGLLHVSMCSSIIRITMLFECIFLFIKLFYRNIVYRDIYQNPIMILLI